MNRYVSALSMLAAMVILAGCAPFTNTGTPLSPTKTTAVATGPLGGLNVYICDEKGNRVIEVNTAGQIIWTASVPAPDDVAPTPANTLIVNSDKHSQVFEVSEKTGKILWTYGRYNQPGSGPGQVNHPEDSFGMPNGHVAITDPGNQRVIQVDQSTGRVVWQYGHTGVPGTLPGYVATTNDAVPLAGGGVLITEAGHAAWNLPPTVLEVDKQGLVVWKVSLPQLRYASDAMPVGGGRYVVTNWVKPGSIDVFNRRGKITWSYGPRSGPGMLNHPSSAERLPNGNYLVSDDYNDRVVVIDPHTNRIVWQYGVTGVPGTEPGHLMGPTDAKAAGELLPPYVRAVGEAG